ncbi:hypothetical protein ACIA8M_17560 [Streptomyces anulatus]
MLTRFASCPDRETAQWATQQVVTGDLLAGRGPVDVRAARAVLRRKATSPPGFVVHTTVPFYL